MHARTTSYYELYTIAIFSLLAETEQKAPYNYEKKKKASWCLYWFIPLLPLWVITSVQSLRVSFGHKSEYFNTFCSLKDLQTVLFKTTSGGIETDKLANVDHF